MGLGLFILVILFLGFAGFVFWVWALVDALRRSDAEWVRADQSKLVWILVMIFLGVLGSLIYLMVARPALEEAKDQPW